jgi:hypothetical protein
VLETAAKFKKQNDVPSAGLLEVYSSLELSWQPNYDPLSICKNIETTNTFRTSEFCFRRGTVGIGTSVELSCTEERELLDGPQVNARMEARSSC